MRFVCSWCHKPCVHSNHFGRFIRQSYGFAPRSKYVTSCLIQLKHTFPGQQASAYNTRFILQFG